ncbi:MAG: hypothetical protein JWM20_966 [Patescibacteria group bacterium]|nr:hypothetical protein [Patescibacteria group bacterium]
MRKFFTFIFAAVLALGAAAQTAPSFDQGNGFSYDPYPDHVVIHYNYDSATVLPVYMTFSLTTPVGDTAVVDSYFVDNTRHADHVVYITPAPAPYTIYKVYFFMTNDSGSSTGFSNVRTAGPNGITPIDTKAVRIVTEQKACTITADESYQGSQVSLYSIIGQKVASEKIEMGQCIVHAQTAGIYILAIDRNGTIETKKILIE